MRWVLATLFTLNVVLFLWIQLGPQGAARTRDDQPHSPDFGRIQLLQELASKPQSKHHEQEARPPATPRPSSDKIVRNATQELSNGKPVAAVDAPGSVKPSSDDLTYCGELGPFPSRNMAEGFRSKLARGRGGQARIESRRGKATVGYWVMIPPLPTSDEAETMLRKLRQAGFKDLWLMRKGEFANGISMGLYTEKRYAKRHGDDIHSKGFETRIVPKQKNARLFWIVFSGVREKNLEVLEKGKLPQGVSLYKKVCSQGSAGN